jgi:hypothetical protein
VPVGVPAEPVTVIEAVTETPKVIGLGGLSVGAGTVGVAALTVCIFTIRQTESEIRNNMGKICGVFIFIHFDASFLT